ncbi:MAG TPA: outer membrane protein assembly factor BamB [Gammaproteobacteria bacterium]
MRRLLPLAILWLTLAACGSSPESIEPPAPLAAFTPELTVQPQWVVRLGKGGDGYFVKLPPLLDAGRVYAANEAGEVAAFDARRGTRLWRNRLGTALYVGPADGGDVVLLGGREEVIALAKRDGSVAWRVNVGNEVLAAPVRAGDTVIARTVDGKVHAIDVPTGNIRWRFSQEVPALSLRGISTPLVVGDMVVSGFANGKVIALALTDGAQLWEAVIAVPRGRNELERMVDVDAQLTARGDLLFAAGYHGQLAALSLRSGQLLWSREISSWSGSALAEDNLYLSDDKGDLWALSSRNGATLWKQTALHARTLSVPVVQGDYLVVGDYDGYLHWIARDDGRIVARVRVEDADYYWPVPSDEPQNEYHEDRTVLAPPVVAGDTVYAMDKRGVLAVFQVSLHHP